MGDLGMFGFWMFIAAAAVGGIWSDVKSKETKQETLRRMVESGRDLDPATIQEVLGKEEGQSYEQQLRTASYITGGVAVGLLLFSLFLGLVSVEAKWVLMGVSALVGSISGGLYLASGYIRRATSGV
ncbi:MAG: hypothetical protein AAGJ86_01905 [Pseudomonadota bacterium]